MRVQVPLPTADHLAVDKTDRASVGLCFTRAAIVASRVTRGSVDPRRAFVLVGGGIARREVSL